MSTGLRSGNGMVQAIRMGRSPQNSSTRTGTLASPHWVGTWSAVPQLTEPGNLPPEPGLSGATLRQVVHASIGGSQIRVGLSNANGNAPVTMNEVRIAASLGGSAIDTSTDKMLSFSGVASVTIPAGATAVSDPLDFTLSALGNVALTIAFGDVPSNVTGHPGSRTTSYLTCGNSAAEASITSAATTDHWYFITGIDVMADARSAAIVVLGDSISDGRGSTTNGNDRWPDNLARRLQANSATAMTAVLNQGVGGNSVLHGGNGPTALGRFHRDVVSQSGARWVIVLEGINDIGVATSLRVAADLIHAYRQFIDDAHKHDMLVYGVPILPFGGNTTYDSVEHQTARDTVNHWIRTSKEFDAVIDLDAAVRDPMAPTKLRLEYDCGDHLHLNPAGYQKMADSIDLTLFTR
jgi:lysophospholipase L1-like esterase